MTASHAAASAVEGRRPGPATRSERGGRTAEWTTICLPPVPAGDVVGLTYQRVAWRAGPSASDVVGDFVDLSPCPGVRQISRVVSRNGSWVATGATELGRPTHRPPQPSSPTARRHFRTFGEPEIADYELERARRNVDTGPPSAVDRSRSIVPTPLLLHDVAAKTPRVGDAGVIEAWFGSPFRPGEALELADDAWGAFHDWHVRSVGSTTRWALIRVWAAGAALAATVPSAPTPGRAR